MRTTNSLLPSLPRVLGLALLALLLLVPPALAKDWDKRTCQKDMQVACKELKKECGHFFKLKDIDWRKVTKTFTKEAKAVKTPGEHYKLLARLVARLEDGHAGVRKTEKGTDIEWPDPSPGRLRGPGMFLCFVEGKVYVKNAWSAASEVGITPGCQLLEIEDMPARKWIEAKAEERGDLMGFSTTHQALASVCHWGLGQPSGSRLKVVFKEPDGRKRSRTITYRRASIVPSGPAIFPEGLGGDDDVRHGRLKSGYGYVHLRRCPSNLPEKMDEALLALRDADGKEPAGLIVDLRANGGGGFDHEGFLGRFVPEGKRITFAKGYESAGPTPYGGPVVVIVDALTRSAGETCAAIFKEDGRAYLIGETPTAGMSSSKKTIELPSGLFTLYVSVASNMKRSNGGEGIEGIGIPPHEVVEYDPEDLAAGRDTLITRAEALLAQYPQEQVPYDPEDFGWRR